MIHKLSAAWILCTFTEFLLVTTTWAQQFGDTDIQLRCPENWIRRENWCYRFVKSPVRPRNEAQKNCRAYEADLLTVHSLDEHRFVANELSWRDPQRRYWYVDGHQQNPNFWVNEADGSSLNDLSAIFLPDKRENVTFPKQGYTNRDDYFHRQGYLNTNNQNIQPNVYYPRDYLAYSYYMGKWGLEKVTGSEHLMYICKAPILALIHSVSEERSFMYGLEVEDPEKIPRGPYFVKQPEDFIYDLQNPKASKDVSMTCLARGYPTPTYEWFKEEYENDKLISKKINPLSDPRYTLSGGSLIINNPQQTVDRGTYYCKATNQFGSIISETVQLAFGFIGEFNLKRAPEYGNQNWGKAIFCDPPEYYPGVKYYWSRPRFPDLVEEDKRVFVSYDGALYFSALEHIDQGSYSCNVLGADNKTSTTGRNGPVFPLTVNSFANPQQLQLANNFPKVFPEAPVAGQEVRLECIAFGYPVPLYNWTRKGSPIPKGSYMTNYNRVLVIPIARMEDEGEYVCRVNNDYSAKEGSIFLSIQAEPNFTIPLTDRHMDVQTDLTWTCEAFGVPEVSYKWYRNGEPLIVDNLPPDDINRYIVQDNILTIKFLNPERDQAMYQCRAKNTLKTVFSSAQLRILSLKPSFKRRPLESESYAGEGGSVTILCNPEAAPKPKITWKRDEVVIGSGGPKTILEGNLTINPVSRSDAGYYMCIAENRFGSDRSSGRLTVLRLPVFYELLPPKMNSIVGQNLELRCYVSSEDRLDVAYAWYHNGLRLQTITTMYSSMLVTGGSLTFYNLTFANMGEYECVVKTVVGKLSTRTTLYVDGPPSAPGGVQVHEVINKTVVLRWTEGSSNGRPILYYIISARTHWDKYWFNVTEIAYSRQADPYRNDRREVTLENVVTPWAAYEFRMYAVNEIGASLPSEPSPSYNIPADKPYIAPPHVSGGGGKIGDLTITWIPLPPKDQNGPDIYYIVYWKRRGFDKEFAKMEVRNATRQGIAIITVPQEFYYTEYDVRVQSANRNGLGPISIPVTIFSAEDIPHVQPQSVIAQPYNSTAIRVNWSPISLARESIRGKLIGHRLKYWLDGQIEDTATYYLHRNADSQALIVGLQPDTYYYIKVMAFNGAGAGPESERILERTYRKAPQNPPTSVFVWGINPSTIKVVWRYVAPNSDEEPVTGYKIRVWPMGEDISAAVDTYVGLGVKLEAYVYNLSPGKKYSVRVLAFSNGGDGRMSSPTVNFQMGHEESFVNSGSKLTNSFMMMAAVTFVLKYVFQYFNN